MTIQKTIKQLNFKLPEQNIIETINRLSLFILKKSKEHNFFYLEDKIHIALMKRKDGINDKVQKFLEETQREVFVVNMKNLRELAKDSEFIEVCVKDDELDIEPCSNVCLEESIE